MAVSFRSASEDVRNTTNSPQPAPPAGTTAGDLLIAVQTCDVNGSLAGMTGATGWTEIGSSSRPADVGYMKVWRKTATSSEPATYTFTDPSTAQGSAIILAVTGYDAAGPISVVPTFANGGAATGHPAPSVAATDGDLLVTAHLAGLAGTARTYTAPPNMTLRPSSLSTGPNTLTGVCTLAINADGATGTKTATCSGSAPYLTMSLVITDLAATGGGGSDLVTFRSSSEDTRNAANNSTPGLPAGTVPGDLMLCVQTSDLNGSLAGMTGATGWTEIGASGRVDTGYMKVWQRVATSSEPTLYDFVDEADAHSSAIIVTLTGQDPTAPLTAVPVFANGVSSTSHTAPSVAIGATGGVLLTGYLAGTGGAIRTYTGPSGMSLVRQSELSAGGNILTGVYRQDLAVADPTGTRTATPSVALPWVAMALVVTPGGNAQSQNIAPAGIGTAAAFGVPTVGVPLTVGVVGIGTAEVVGTAAIVTIALDQTVTAIGIPAATAIGIPAVNVVPTIVFSGPYPGIGTFPGATTYPGLIAAVDQTVAPFGIDSAEVSGIPDVSIPATSPQIVRLNGIDPTDGFGTPQVSAAPVGGLLPDDPLYPADDLYPSGADDTATVVAVIGIPSALSFGFPLIADVTGPQTVVITAIDSAEAFGQPIVAEDRAPDDLDPIGIDSAEAFGRPTINREVPPPVVNPDFLDTYFIDGLDLSTFATQIEVAEGLQDTPGTVGDNIVLPGRDGELAVLGQLGQQRRPDAAGRITFSMWLIGVDPDTGDIPSDSSSAEEYLARWDELVRLFHRRKLTIDHPRPDGTRRAVGHLMPGETMAPSSRAASPWFGRFKATLAVPGAHWTDLDTVTTGPQQLASGGTLSLDAFATATAPCTELTVTFGSGANPRLSTSYGHVGWNGVITAGRQVGIDTVDGRVHQAGGDSWVPGYESLTYSPGPRLFEIDPTESLQAVFTHTTGGTMTVEVSGKRRYRTS